MDSDTKSLVGQLKSHKVQITSSEEAQLRGLRFEQLMIELRRLNHEIAKINERANSKFQKTARFLSVLFIFMLTFYITLNVLQILTDY